MKKSIVFITVLIILIGAWIAFRMYNKPHRDPVSESAIQVSAIELFRNYESNETEANNQYLDKVLAVSGKVTEITVNQESFPVIVFETENPMFTVRCTMGNKDISAKVGDAVVIKGICTGYLSDVIIVNGIIAR